jgi:replicative DNA helicase
MHEHIVAGRDWTLDVEHLIGLQSDTTTSDRLMSGAAFVSAQPEGHPTVWGDGEEVLWAAGQSLFVVGPPGVGKSTLTTQLVAGRLGLQEKVLGYEVEMTGSKVLYLACDRPTQIAGLFKRLFGPDDMEALEEGLVVWRGPLEQDVAQHPDLLTRMCQASGCDTLVIDSLKDITTELSTDEAGGGVNRALQMTLAEGIEVLVCHHQKKGQGGAKPKTLEDVHGNSAFRNGAGSVVLLWGAAGDPVVELSHLKQPVAPVGPLSIIHDHASGRSRVEGSPTDPLKVMKQRAGGLTAHDLAAMDCGGDPSKNETEKARNRLERLVKKSLARRVPGEKGEADRYVAVLPEP